MKQQKHDPSLKHLDVLRKSFDLLRKTTGAQSMLNVKKGMSHIQQQKTIQFLMFRYVGKFRPPGP